MPAPKRWKPAVRPKMLRMPGANRRHGVLRPRQYTPAMYLQYELTRFKLDFAQPTAAIRALPVCPVITEEQKQAYYRNNPDLFTRYWGDSFPYEDVEQIIEKRLREEAYDALVQDLLRQR